MTLTIVDQAMARTDSVLERFGLPTAPCRGGWIAWSSLEEAALREWYGRLPLPELAERVNAVLRQRSGNPHLSRTVAAITNRAAQLGLKAYNGEPQELHLSAAARSAELAYDSIWRAVRNGELQTVQRGKYRYVTKQDFACWLLQYRARQEAKTEMLVALAGTKTVSKKEAMALSGLSETHLSRYLKTGVIQAWKVPEGVQGRGYWRVEQHSIAIFLLARAEGRLSELLDAHPAYVALRRQQTATLAALRHQKQLGQPDPLTTPQSKYHPGCFTLSQIASHLKAPIQVIREALARGEVQAEAIYRGGRFRYALTPAEAQRYVAAVQAQASPSTLEHSHYRQQIAQAGLLTVADLIKRWQVGPEVIYRYSQHGYRGHILPSRRWGRLRVFELADVEFYEKELELCPL